MPIKVWLGIYIQPASIQKTWDTHLEFLSKVLPLFNPPLNKE